MVSIDFMVKAEGAVYERTPASARRHEILGVMRISEGRLFKEEDLARDIEYLTETSHMFRDVEAEITYDEELEGTRVKLVFTQPLVWRIRVVAPRRGQWSEDGVEDFWRARNKIDTSEDAEFSIDRLDADVKRVYETGGFLDVRAEFKYTENGVDVLFRVIQNQSLSIVQFSGVYQPGYSGDLERVIAGIDPIRELPVDPGEGELVSPRYFPRAAFDGDIVTDANAANILGAARQIEAYYKVNGFPFIEVKPRLISLPRTYDREALREEYGQLTGSTLGRCRSLIDDGYGGDLVLIFEIYEGEKLLVGDITFEGLEGTDSPDSDALEGSRVGGFFGPIYQFWYKFLADKKSEQAAALGEEMKTEEGGPFVEGDVIRDAETLQSYFRNRGWLDATVTFSNLRFNETRSRADVVFHIDPGPVYAFNTMRIEYATQAPRVPEGAEPREFDDPVVTFEELLEFLNLDGQVLPRELAEAMYGADYVATMTEPGQGLHFAGVQLDRPVPYDDHALNGSPGTLEEGFAGRIQALLADRGYSNIELEFVRIETQDETLETDWETPWPVRRVELIIRLQQGYESIVGNVTFRGNEATRDDVIRRNVDLYPGEVYDRNRKRGSDNRLRRMQWFEQAAPAQGVISRTSPRLERIGNEIIEFTDIDYELIEGRTNQFNFAAGFNSSTGFTASVDLTLMNFDISSFVSWLWGEPNFSFTGAGQTLSFTAQPPLDRQQVYRISFSEPWLFGYPLGGSVSGEFSSINYPDYSRSRIGVDPAVSWRVLPDVRWGFGYRYSVVRLFDIASDAPQELKDDQGTERLSTVWSEINWNTTDNPQFPTTGWDLSYLYEYTGGPLFGGTLDFWRMRAKGSLYVPLWDLDETRTMVLAFSAQAWWQDIHSDTRAIPFIERFLMGGNSVSGRGTLRGFDFAGVGPSRGGVALGGNFMVHGYTELRVPIFPGNLWAVAFVDVGQLSPTLNTFQPTDGWTVSGGFGLRLLLPILPVPFALDFGFPIINQPGNREQLISINLGFGF